MIVIGTMDHDHYNGKYEGAAHEFYNVQAHLMFLGSRENMLFSTTQIMT